MAALAGAFLQAVRAALGDGAVTTEPSELAEYGRDRTRDHDPAPGAIAFPRSTEDVARLVPLCGEHGVAIVPSGGRTGLSGGAMATRGELVVSLTRMRAIGPVDAMARTVRVEAGAVTQAVHERAAEHGLTWPVDFASKGSSTVGGNIATNAGGVKVIRWGPTRNWVLGLQVVIASGEVLELGGDLEKNNTGYDLKQLFIGSEGTLGVVTAATLKLAAAARAVDVVLLGVASFDDVMAVFESARARGFVVTAYEFFTDRCAARVERHRGRVPPLGERAPFYVLVELERGGGGPGGARGNHDGEPAGADGELLAWAREVLARPGTIDGVIAGSAAQAGELWALREDISESLAATGLPHKNDVALPLRALAPFHRDLERALADAYPGWEACLFGHVGDGNIHVNMMKPDAMSRAEFLARTREADRALFELVRAHGGSISAEHGVGLLKVAFLGYSRSPGELEMMRAIKRALDPGNLFNPGKIFELER